jgi:ABC-type nitrate/sulfonate/bicarbonate transport system ATPase subunit
MRQKICIARAIAFNGGAFILDEPFKALDWEAKKKLTRTLLKATENKLCVLVTHDHDEAVLMADRIYYFDGPPLTLKNTADPKGKDADGPRGT